MSDHGSSPTDAKPPPRKKARKSRSRGLRTTTGCLTCRKRHMKCDEQEPVCGPCTAGRKTCTYSADRPKHTSSAAATTTTTFTGASAAASLATMAQQPPASSAPAAAPAAPAEQLAAASTAPGLPTSAPPQVPTPLDSMSSFPGPGPDPEPAPESGSSTGPLGAVSQGPEENFLGYSPETSDLLTAGGASTRWLDLLASDAAQADAGFSLVSSPTQEATDRNQGPVSSGALHARLSTLATAPTTEYAWQEFEDIVLLDREALLFRKFAERAALWLDLLDPGRHFSTYATRLALRNVGLMKAILALTARHEAMSKRSDQPTPSQSEAEPSTTHRQAIQYYYETLHYVQTALVYTTYTLSEEILATAAIISMYEMLDESASNWQRHLKGVFWIQRSQDADGESGGLRQAVWWAWLRQDIWAAFREKRKCLSIWIPKKTCADMTQHELANWALWLLSKAVNYSAAGAANPFGNPSSPDPDVIRGRSNAATELLGKLEEWKMYLGPGFQALPATKAEINGAESPFPAIWIHPPNFAVAMMVYHFAKILIMMHRPPEPGFNHYLKTQRTLSESVAGICGIAIALREEGCQILAAQCLFGAGLCVQEPAQRNAVLSLIGACEERSGWPLSTMKSDLLAEWSRADQDGNV